MQRARRAPVRRPSATARARRSPAHHGRADSKSTGLTPTLPICGAVIVDDLPAVRRVGQHLLVAGDRRVEHDLADRLARARRSPRRGRRCRPPCEQRGRQRSQSRVVSLPSSRFSRVGDCTVDDGQRRAAGELVAEERRVPASATQRRRVDRPGRSGSITVMSASAPTASAPPGKPNARAGATLMRVDRALRVERPHTDEVEDDRQRGLEAEHAGRRALELDVLLDRRVRRVVGRDASIVPSASASRSASTPPPCAAAACTFVAVS